MGSTTNYVLFSSNGSITNLGLSHLTGDVGSHIGAVSGFGNVNGVMHNSDAATAQCAADLLQAYLQLDATPPDFNVAPLLGNGDTLVPGVYAINAATVLGGALVLDGKGLPNTTFVFQIEGALSVDAGSKVTLINGAMACDVFWKVEGMIDVGAGSTLRGNFIANNAAITFNANDTLEGRALSTTGAVTVNGLEAAMPLGCGIPALLGPPLPAMGTVACYALFSGSGTVSNIGVTHVTGDVGTNNGLTTGFDPLLVVGTVHLIPDASTSACASDLAVLYGTLNGLAPDIELLFPAQFGGNLVLTPHTYLLNAATSFTDTLYLDAQGSSNAVFVILINGALATSTFANVVLRNGALADNVFWKVEGAVEVNDFSTFVGTIVCNNAAVNLHSNGVRLIGRAVLTTGALATTAIEATVPTACTILAVDEDEAFARADPASPMHIGPNPFGRSSPLSITLGDDLQAAELHVFDGMGKQVMLVPLLAGTTQLATGQLAAGMYFYRLHSTGGVVQTGRLVAIP